MTGYVLIDGWPAAWGAARIGLPAGSTGTRYRCGACARTVSAVNGGPLWYPAGTVSTSLASAAWEWICPACAKAHCQATYVACDLTTDGPWAWYWRLRFETNAATPVL